MIKDTSFSQFLTEGFVGHFDVPDNSMERAQRLKQLILGGDVPDVWVAGYVRGKFSFGDLEKLGYAKRHEGHYDRFTDEGEMWWEYDGPKTICAVMTRSVFEPGQPGQHSEIRKYMRQGETTEKTDTFRGPSE